MGSHIGLARWIAIFLLLIACAACNAAKSAPLTIGQLRNAEYRAEFLPGGKVELRDGLYAHQGVLYKLDPTYALGDLNGDGIEEAAIILTAQGERVVSYLMVAGKEKESPRHIASALLGERAKIRSLAIHKGQITLLMTLAGDSDCLCEPPQITQVYRLDGNKLLLLE